MERQRDLEREQVKQKIGRNPNKPGTDVVIPPRAIVKFKPGKEMKERNACCAFFVI